MAGINTKIDKDDYNAIQSVIARILGVGSANSGYGQTVLSSQVTVSDAVTVNEYAALRYDIINVNKHIFNATPSGINDQTIGAKVRYDAANAPINYWLSIANSLDTVRLTLAPAGQRVSINHGTNTFTGAWGSNTNPQLACVVTCEWTNSEQARFFFNSGSSIQFTSSRTGGSSTAQNTSWTTLLSTAGARIFGGATPGTGTSPADGQNFFRLTDAGQTWSNVVASSPYSLNEFSITAETDDTPVVSNNSAGTSKKLRFEVFWNDNHFPLGGDSASGTPVQPGTFGPDTVDGTVSLTVQTVKASGVLEPTGSGNFTIETPTVTIGPITN
jgi:hypothetical protein